MIDVDDVFNRLSYINYSYQSIQTNKNGVGAFFCFAYKNIANLALGYNTKWEYHITYNLELPIFAFHIMIS